MLPITFQTSLIAILQIFAMGALGFYLVKSGLVAESGLKLISFLTVNVFFPLFIFYQIITNFSVAHMPFWWQFPCVSVILPLIGLCLASLLVWRHQRPHKTAFLAMASFHNGGYLPMLVVASLPMGAMAGQLFAGVIFSIVGFDICIWSFGVWLLTREQTKRMDFRKILNPPLISMFVAWLIVLTVGPGFVPAVILKPISTMGQGTMGFAMLLIGGNLAMTTLDQVNWTEITAIVLFKLIFIPFLALIVLLKIKLNPLVAFIAMLNACMPCSITTSIIARNYETRDQALINQAIFVSHVLSIITIPIFLGAYGKLVG